MQCIKIFDDIKVACGLVGQLRAERKRTGADTGAKLVHAIPLLDLGYWCWTPEACLFYAKKWAPVKEVFGTLPEWKQHELTFAPEAEAGAYLERVRFWQQQLQPELLPEVYHAAMIVLIQWARRNVERRQRERGMVATYEVQD